MMASRTLQPRTSPVAFLKTSVGASEPAALPPMSGDFSSIDITPPC